MITLEKYKTYFRLDDGVFVKNVPPCVYCTELNFNECLKTNEGCEDFNIIAKRRGWQSDIEGFDIPYSEKGKC